MNTPRVDFLKKSIPFLLAFSAACANSVGDLVSTARGKQDFNALSLPFKSESRSAHARKSGFDGEKIEIFVLAGQSNMKGRGAVPDIQPMDESVLAFSESQNKWITARHPLHLKAKADLLDGSSNAGYGPGLDFARTLLLEREDVTIALIPAAKGGAPVNLWLEGRPLYEAAVEKAKAAIGFFEAEGIPSRVAGVLWLQGESDAIKNRYQSYSRKLDSVVRSFRDDLDEPRLPFIACTIGSFIKPKGKYLFVSEINEVLLTLPERMDWTACVDARDLGGHIGDFMHYDTGSQRIIGRRMAEAYSTIVDRKGEN